LYLPSNDHLAHALASNTRFRAVPPGSETDYERPRAGRFVPQFFSSQDYAAIHRLVTLLLGEPLVSPNLGSSEDDTIVDKVAHWVDRSVYESAAAREAARNLAPQHRALAVAYYGEDDVHEAERSDPQRIAREGLHWLGGEALRQHGKSFVQLAGQQQQAIVALISDSGTEQDNAGTRFFRWLKGETIRGFYTSKIGLKELDYKGNYFYTESPGCAAPTAT
jgi:hypothetical protein